MGNPPPIDDVHTHGTVHSNKSFGHTHNGHTLISSRLSQFGTVGSCSARGTLTSGSLDPAIGNATAPTDACPSSLLLSARLPAPAALLPPLLPPRAPPTMLPPPCSPVVTPGALIPWNRRPARRYFARDRLVLGRSLVVGKGFPCYHVQAVRTWCPAGSCCTERFPSSPALRGPSLPFLNSPAPSSSLQECEQRPRRCRGHSRPRLFAVQ